MSKQLGNNVLGCILCLYRSTFPVQYRPAVLSGFIPVVFRLVSGLTDIIDGAVARSTNTVSAFGARLDSLADIMFVSVCMWKLLPVAELKYSAPLVCTVATFAAIQEGHFIRTGREN